jgi:hypothetical protein
VEWLNSVYARLLACRQSRDIAKVKHDGALLKKHLNIDSWVPGSSVDQARVQNRSYHESFAAGQPDAFDPYQFIRRFGEAAFSFTQGDERCA